MFRALRPLVTSSRRLGKSLTQKSGKWTQTRNLYQVPMKELNFLMNDVFDFPKHYETLKHTNGEMATPDMVEMMLEGMATFAERELEPLDEGSDTVGCKQLGPNEIKTPPGFKEAYQSYVNDGWQGLSFPSEYGGQGLPSSLQLIQTEMTATACWTWTMFPGLSKGAINTILNHGTEELKEKYLSQLISGEYTGTMCLTEPQCGSDLGQVKTKAEPIEGTNKYKISGTKIFISCGEHDMVDNIIHCVLARLPGAPPGTRGISLFAVPKLKEDGSVNSLEVGRIEDKMGCHGSPTCEMIFHESEGELIGTENKGLNHMFTFINTSRMGTAIQGLAACEKSYQNGLAYALERKAMHSLQKRKPDPNDPDLIIVHPAVRSMLLKQKVFAEGGRAMILECAKLEDLRNENLSAGTPEGEKKAKQLEDKLGFLTPILKGFLTEIGLESSNMGIQVFGGHGYIKSNKQEQIVRDVRIASVWEGTTQIQALDLLGRKIMLQQLKPINSYCSEIYSLCRKNIFSAPSVAVRSHALSLFMATAKLQAATLRIANRARKDRNYIGIASEPYLMYAGYLQLGVQWLRMEQAAAEKLKGSGLDEAAKAFYDSKVKSSQFYFDCVLPRTVALRSEMLVDQGSLMSMPETSFAFNEK